MSTITAEAFIEFEDKEQLLKWLKEFYLHDEDVVRLPGIPYSYSEIKSELFKRYRVEDMIGGLPNAE